MNKIRSISIAGLYSWLAAIFASFGSLAALTSRNFYIFWGILLLSGFLHYKAHSKITSFAKENVIILPRPEKRPIRNYLALFLIAFTLASAFVTGGLQILFGLISVSAFWILFYFEFTITKKDREAIIALNPNQPVEVVATYRTTRSSVYGALKFTLVVYLIISVIYLL